jgi:hypothetical protein
LRVEEAAKVLRIGRTTAYALANEFLDTHGASGLPVVRLGKQLRVSRVRLEQMLDGTITWPPRATRAEKAESAVSARPAVTTPRHVQRRGQGSFDQRTLSFPS